MGCQSQSSGIIRTEAKFYKLHVHKCTYMYMYMHACNNVIAMILVIVHGAMYIRCKDVTTVHAL